MKTQIALVSLLALGLASQTASADTADYAVAQRDLHSRVWQKLTLATNAAGLVRTNVHTYTELRNGLCRPENGVLVDFSKFAAQMSQRPSSLPRETCTCRQGV